MSNWQPIESAPVSGEFLVLGGTLVGRSSDDRPNNGIVHVERAANGRFEIANTDYYTAHVEKPTKWHPLPEIT